MQVCWAAHAVSRLSAACVVPQCLVFLLYKWVTLEYLEPPLSPALHPTGPARWMVPPNATGGEGAALLHVIPRPRVCSVV